MPDQTFDLTPFVFPPLRERNLWVGDHAGRIVLRTLVAPLYFDDTHTERVGTGDQFLNTYEFSVAGGHQSNAYIHEKSEVVLQDAFGVLRAFVVKGTEVETTESGSALRVSCEDAAQDELLTVIITPSSSTDDDAPTILATILADSRWQVGNVEAGATTLSHDWSYETAWEGVIWVAQEFGLEIRTRVSVVGSFITGRYIDLVRNRGRYTGRILSYDRDTTSLRRTGDGGEVYTAIYGLGGGSPATTFTDEEWTVAGGDPVDKPTSQAWVGDAAAQQIYGIRYPSGALKHRFGVFRDTGEEVAARLLTKSWEFLQEHKQPQYTYDCDLATLALLPDQKPNPQFRPTDPISCGDLVVVRDKACFPPYQAEVRVIETRRSYSDPSKDSLTLGAPRKKLSDFMRDITLLKRTLNQ